MTAFLQPDSRQPLERLLTVAEYAALPEDDQHRWELQEGIMVVPPSPPPRHMAVVYELAKQPEPHLPPGMHLLLEVDIDLGWCLSTNLGSHAGRTWSSWMGQPMTAWNGMAG